MSHTDVHQLITDRIVAAIDANPGSWQQPWAVRPGSQRPANVVSGQRYRGINTLALWAEAQLSGYTSHLWGSYRQWAALGAQVRKGERASSVVFFKEVPLSGTDTTGSDDREDAPTRLFARTTPVFNADQVDGLALQPPPPVSGADALPAVDRFVEKLHASIVHGGDIACYQPRLDVIRMPDRHVFGGSATSGATESYYATLTHELTHWTSAKHRCNRDLHPRFGINAYAMEELVAELGAAFLCADLGISKEPRADHAQYLRHWLKVMKTDKRAIFTAASKAAQAVSFMTDRVSEGGLGRPASQPPKSSPAHDPAESDVHA